jgi:hypothetical protein
MIQIRLLANDHHACDGVYMSVNNTCVFVCYIYIHINKDFLLFNCYNSRVSPTALLSSLYTHTHTHTHTYLRPFSFDLFVVLHLFFHSAMRVYEEGMDLSEQLTI